MWKNYELDDSVFELSEDLTLCRSEKVLVSCSKGGRAIVVKHKDRKEGFVFLGHGKLMVDTIVETENGAFGKPIDRELNDPFLMLGNVGEILRHLRETNKEDLLRDRVKVEDLFGKAQSLVDRLFRRRIFGCHYEGKGLVFGFAAGEDRFDVLVINDSRLVFKSKDLSFVSSGSNTVLNKAGQVVLATYRNSVFVHRLN